MNYEKPRLCGAENQQNAVEEEGLGWWGANWSWSPEPAKPGQEALLDLPWEAMSCSGFEVRMSWVQIQYHYFITVQPWATYLTSLNFPISKMGNTTDSLHRRFVKVQWDICKKFLLEVWGRMDPCTRTAEFLCCPPKTITTLLIGHTPILNKKFKVWKTKEFSPSVP